MAFVAGSVQLTVIGTDDTTTVIDFDLDLVQGSNLKLGSEIGEITSVGVSASPPTTITAAGIVKNAGKHIVTLTFSAPLGVGNNYQVNVFMGMLPI